MNELELLLNKQKLKVHTTQSFCIYTRQYYNDVNYSENTVLLNNEPIEKFLENVNLDEYGLFKEERSDDSINVYIPASKSCIIYLVDNTSLYIQYNNLTIILNICIEDLDDILLDFFELDEVI